MNLLILSLLCFAICLCARGETQTRSEMDVSYRSGADLDEYSAARCKLDLYLPPATTKNFPTMVWFHGGGMESGDKSTAYKMGLSLAAEGIAVVAVNYRLNPKVKFPAYIEDSAAAAAWVLKNIAERGGDKARVFISGHSAGGYLTMMLALDEQYLKKHGVRSADFAGYIPVSGQAVTHSTVRKERGIGRETEVVDEAAPLHFVRKDAPPLLLITADKDMARRVDENQRLLTNLKEAGCKHVQLLVVPKRDHGSVGEKIAEPGDPARAAVVEFVNARK